MRLVGISDRYHFVWIENQGLKDVLHPFVYKFWPKQYIHTYPEIMLNNKWIELDATYDKE